jgi:hypothetical protein
VSGKEGQQINPTSRDRRRITKMDNVRTMSEVYAELGAKVVKGNNLIANNALSADFLAGFAKLEAEYAAASAKATYQALRNNATPIIDAIRQYSYTVMKHQEVKDTETKRITELKLVERQKQIDLLKMCKAIGKDDGWQYDAMAFNQWLCLRAAVEMGLSKADIANIAKTYYLQQKAVELADGKPVVSNNALTRGLQGVIDAILTNDGVDTHKCNNHDINYLLLCYAKKGKSALSVAVAKDGYLRNLIMDVMHRIICNKMYTVEYSIKKDATPATPKSPVSAETEAVIDEIMSESAVAPKVVKPKKPKAKAA